MGLPKAPLSRVVDAVARVADRVREVRDGPGLEVTTVDLDERRTLRRVGRPPYWRVWVDLTEARDALYRLPAPRDDRDAQLVVAALLARDLAPARDRDDWERLGPFVAAALGRLGADVQQAVEIVEAVIAADWPE